MDEHEITPAGPALFEVDALYALGDDPQPRRGPTRRIAAALLGASLLLGGVAFAATQMKGGGPSSPEAAVDELLSAASDEDLLGVLASLDPGERDVMVEPVQDLFAELERLEIVSGMDLASMDGLDLSFDGVTYRVQEVRDGLARVYLTGGTVTTGYVADELPVGDFVADTLDRFEIDIAGMSDSETNPVVEPGSDEVFLVARRTGEGWRVSIGYTIAEYAREDAGVLLSGLAPLEPIGAASPEEAVREMAQAVADLDLAGVIARLSPSEMGALQDYAGMFLDDAQAAIGDSEMDIELRDLTLERSGSGDRVTVLVSGFDVAMQADGLMIELLVEGDCMTISGDAEVFDGAPFPAANGEKVCAGDFAAMYQDMLRGFGLKGLEDELSGLPPIEPLQLGITTVRVDGAWYVAPVSTGFDSVVAGLRVLERSHLDAFVDLAETFMESFESGFGGGSFDVVEASGAA